MLYNRYRRVDGAWLRMRRGRGLGLYECESFCRTLSVSVESRLIPDPSARDVVMQSRLRTEIFYRLKEIAGGSEDAFIHSFIRSIPVWMCAIFQRPVQLERKVSFYILYQNDFIKCFFILSRETALKCNCTFKIYYVWIKYLICFSLLCLYCIRVFSNVFNKLNIL